MGGEGGGGGWEGGGGLGGGGGGREGQGGGGSRWGCCRGGGGGESGTSKQLGMRPMCDPTVRTAPCPNRGQGIIGLGIPNHAGNLKGVGSRGGHGIRVTQWHKTYIYIYRGWMQVHKCGHSNSGWWPWTTRHDCTSPLPAYTTLAQASCPNVSRWGREGPKTKSGYLEHFLWFYPRRGGPKTKRGFGHYAGLQKFCKGDHPLEHLTKKHVGATPQRVNP